MSGVDSQLSGMLLSGTLGKLTSLCFEFPIFKMYLPHKVVERVTCVTVRCLERCLAQSKHSNVGLKSGVCVLWN